MLNISFTIIVVNSVFVILCSFCGDMLHYQNIKCVFLTEAAGMFNFGVQMMQLCSENKADFTKLTGSLGRYLQIRDDYCNLCLHEVILSYQF
jgi:hypothetical protein